jgi:hypothetical protein
MSFEEYGELAGVGFKGAPESVPPEEEFFKSVYIAGITRKNHINVEEQAGKLQIRGLQYNLDKVHMVITHTKEILVREADKGTRALYSCFSFKDGQPPWYGTTKLPDDRPRPCPATSAERAVNDFCAPCRGQILVAGICCKEDGTPITDGAGKPVFVFVRGKGTKYGNISAYLGEMFKLDLPPIFEPVTEQSQAFEKAVVNNKRFVTTISVGQADTRYGSKNVFVLTKGVEIAKESVLNILKVSKQTLEKFNEKFDWSKRVQAASAPPADGILSMDPEPKNEDSPKDPEPTQQPKKDESAAQKTFSFDNIEF